MASTKKTKKAKGVTISFQEFTARVEGEDNKPSAGQNVVYNKKNQALSSWADEVEEEDFTPMLKERIVLPSAPRASRGPAYEDKDIPKVAPFQVNLGNLNYDIDEEDLYKFFKDLDITEVKLPRDRETNRIKGFGFVTFDNRNDLIEALIRNEQMLRGRPVRIALGQPKSDYDNARGGQRSGGGGRSQYQASEDEGVDNWRSMMGADLPPPPPPHAQQQQQRRQGYGGGGGESNYEGGGQNERGGGGGEEEESTWRRGGGGGGGGGGNYDNNSRGNYDNNSRGNYGNSNRRNNYEGGGGEEEEFVRPPTTVRVNETSRGPPPASSSSREYSSSSRESRGGNYAGAREDYQPRSNARGEDYPRNNARGEDYPRNNARGEDYPRSNARGGEDYPRSNARGGEDYPRSNARRGGEDDDRIRRRRSSREDEDEEYPRPRATDDDIVKSENNKKGGEVKQRKKLVLVPRGATSMAKETAAEGAGGRSSIFGEAKPVDTSKREKEIELKLNNKSVGVVDPQVVVGGEEKDSHSDPEDDRDFFLSSSDRRQPSASANQRKGAAAAHAQQIQPTEIVKNKFAALLIEEDEQ